MRFPVSLLILATLTFGFGLGRQAITDSDEAFYAEAAREMVESGDWLTPHYNYEDRWQKPVLYYWLTAGVYGITGPTEWAARIWSALSGLGLVLLTWAAARDIAARSGGGSTTASWTAAAIVATCYGYFAMARMALPDLPLTFFITLGIWAAMQGWWVVAGAAAGLGFLMKGPVALLVPGLVLLPIWLRERVRWRTLLPGMARAALVFALVGLPWYLAMWRAHGDAYLESFFIGDNVERFATERFNELRSPFFYVPVLLGGLMPWTAFLVLLVPSGVAAVRRRLTPTALDWRLLLWAVMPLLFFSISVGKQPRYVLPVLPPIAMAIGRALAAHIERGRTGGDIRLLRGATWATAALFAAMVVLFLRAAPLFLNAYPAATMIAGGAMLGGALAIASVASTRRWFVLPAVLAVSASALLLAVQFGALAGRRPEAVEEMAALVRAQRTANERVAEYGVFVRNMVFYTRFPQIDLFADPQAAADFIGSPDRVLMLVPATELPALEERAGVKTRTLGSVRYLDTAGLRARDLLWPDPGTRIKDVLLVTNR